jgi:hypothetical protein
VGTILDQSGNPVEQINPANLQRVEAARMQSHSPGAASIIQLSKDAIYGWGCSLAACRPAAAAWRRPRA